MSNTAYDIVPSMKVQSTQVLIENQGYTYNQAGFTYNQAGVMYGGAYNITQDIVPQITSAYNIVPHALAGRVESSKEFVPIVSMAYNIKPTIYNYSDIYSPAPTPPPPGGAKNGPGFFMYVNLT